MTSKRSILAGIFIGIGGMIYLSVESKILGAALFALGILAVLVLECNLYTGKVAYIQTKEDIIPLLLMCFRNFVGIFIIGLIASIALKEKAVPIVIAKLSTPLWYVFLKAVLCGVAIYLSVELYKRTKEFWLAVMPIMIFILCGFEHCVANIFYFSASLTFDIKMIPFTIVCIIGNGVGSVAIRLLQKYEL